LKRATDEVKKYLHSICDKIMEFQRIRCYDSLYLQTKKLGWKENHEIQNTGTENSKGNITEKNNQVLKIWENYITELYDQPKGKR
jgi:hypothetical protein